MFADVAAVETCGVTRQELGICRITAGLAVEDGVAS
jgi:hypothetical protein